MSVGIGIMDWSELVKEVIAGMPTLSLLLPQPKEMPPTGQENMFTPTLSASDDNENLTTGESSVQPSANDNFKHFIRRMIEIRDILKTADLEQSLELPRIVVIGSQSSGKSSVLESIVGHEFLPKGQNMVTRRPLELTLVHSPKAGKDYGVFKTDGNDVSGPIYDFNQIQSRLSELNMAVPETQWVSSDPIELTIYSPNVPDLTLVDLPGYIQISNKKQPPVLREKIAELCERYIQGTNNLVLAVCPADVDLANAEALKAAQRVDPLGERTVGVITKMDLVDPRYGAELLKNEDYPLKLGYIGVVCKSTESMASKLFGQHHPDFFSDLAFSGLNTQTGIQSLRNVLTGTLEHNMLSSLDSILFRVQDKLSEVRYQLKVEYNDRVISPESYVSTLMTHLKGSLEHVVNDFNRASVRHQIDSVLKHLLLQVIEQYLAEPEQTSNELILEDRLRMSVSALTKSGVGKKAIGSLVESIAKDIEARLTEGPLAAHPGLRDRLSEEFVAQLKNRSGLSADMVENALKPYKEEIEFTPAEWIESRSKVLSLMDAQIKSMSERIEAVQKEVGSKRLRKVIQYLASNSAEKTVIDEHLSERSFDLLVKGKEVAELSHRVKVLKKRYEYIKSSSVCASMPVKEDHNGLHWFTSLLTMVQLTTTKSSQLSNTPITNAPCLKHCPELYLLMIHERLLQVSSLFVHHELVHEFLQPLLLHDTPTLSRLAQGSYDRQSAMPFVAENPVVSRHIQLLERRIALEKAREKLAYLKQRRDDN